MASSFGNLARLPTAIVMMKRARALSMPRSIVCAMPPGRQRDVHHEQIEDGDEATKQKGEKREHAKVARGGFGRHVNSFFEIMTSFRAPLILLLWGKLSYYWQHHEHPSIPYSSGSGGFPAPQTRQRTA
ncbi:hypothetical protein RPE78_13910 (plasmid) [Thioclava litoralis]|uniref:Uncharacterized protein n=1 Tax=Thioclava litoralis TaxID=3076557 RepID=A0ABZ1E2R3_9RHOB|nr:hypothetical protein RPE78_13910 [Thioclava sp. FTW29]